jgi:hypothetical protein
MNRIRGELSGEKLTDEYRCPPGAKKFFSDAGGSDVHMVEASVGMLSPEGARGREAGKEFEHPEARIWRSVGVTQSN